MKQNQPMAINYANFRKVLRTTPRNFLYNRARFEIINGTVEPHTLTFEYVEEIIIEIARETGKDLNTLESRVWAYWFNASSRAAKGLVRDVLDSVERHLANKYTAFQQEVVYTNGEIYKARADYHNIASTGLNPYQRFEYWRLSRLSFAMYYTFHAVKMQTYDYDSKPNGIPLTQNWLNEESIFAENWKP